MTMVHPVDPHHFVRALSMVSGRLAEAFATNSKPKGFEDTVLTSLHTYADDTPQAPSPRVDQSQPKRSDVYRSSYTECRCNDTSHSQSRRHFTLHSYHSNARRSRSVPSIIVYTLVLYVTYLSLIIFKIIPHPMTLLAALSLQVIILHYI
jgi:hypothetical protein